MIALLRPSLRWLTPSSPARAWVLGMTTGMTFGALVTVIIAGPAL